MNRPPDGGEAVSADRAVLDAANNAFEDYAQTFLNTAEPLGSAHDGVISGAGEFSGEVETGAAQFLLGWNEAFGVCSETSAVIAGNIGNYWLDLEDTDIDATVSIDITGTA